MAKSRESPGQSPWYMRTKILVSLPERSGTASSEPGTRDSTAEEGRGGERPGRSDHGAGQGRDSSSLSPTLTHSSCYTSSVCTLIPLQITLRSSSDSHHWREVFCYGFPIPSTKSSPSAQEASPVAAARTPGAAAGITAKHS